MGRWRLPVEAVTTGSRERLLNDQFRQWVSDKAEKFSPVQNNNNNKKLEERFCSGDVNCIADWGGKSVKEPLVKTVGSVSSSTVHALSAPGRDFSFHISFRTCCTPSKSPITLSCTSINTKNFTSWKKTGCSGRRARGPGATGGLFASRCSTDTLSQGRSVSAEDELHLPRFQHLSYAHKGFVSGFLHLPNILLHLPHASSTTYNILSQIKHGSCFQKIKYLKTMTSSATYLKPWATALFPKEQKARS